MKRSEVYLKPVPKDIIELAKDHTRMSAEISNILLLIMNLSKGEDYTWVLNKSSRYEEIRWISGEIRRLFEENNKLKEEVIAKMNFEQKQEIHNQINNA